MADDATHRPYARHGFVESEVPGNPVLGAPGPRKRRPKPRTRRPAEVLTDAEVRALLAACGDDLVGIRHRALLVMMYRAGLRISEALSLRPHDLDLAGGTVRVRFAKGGRDRVVGLDPGAGAVVGAWAERRATLAVPAVAPIFCSRSGRALTTAYIRRLLPILGRAAGIAKRVHAHGLRHTHAAQLRAEGVDIGIISRQLGHRSILTTIRYLDHINSVAVVEAMRGRVWGQVE